MHPAQAERSASLSAWRVTTDLCRDSCMAEPAIQAREQLVVLAREYSHAMMGGMLSHLRREVMLGYAFIV